MWTKGIQAERLDFSAKAVNEEIKEQKGFLEEREAKVLMYKFFRNNVTYAAQFFLGIKLFPFQALLIKALFIADYTMHVLARGMSKTFSTAIYLILECLLNQNANIGVIAGTFRQSKMIFSKIEDILGKPKAKLTMDCISAKNLISKGTDQWTLKIGGAKAIALPLANGERLRGFRFNRIVIDEFLTMPEKIFTEVIMPFLGVVENPDEREELAKLEDRLIEAGEMTENDRYVWPNNKLILLSSPSFTFEYMYKLYKQFKDLIMGQHDSQRYSDDDDEEIGASSAYRCIFQLSYDMAPKQLYDQNLLKQARATMSEAQFNREFGAQFGDEGDSYFKMSKMMGCTIPEGEFPAVEIIGNPSDEYILAFDPSWSESEEADFFSMHVGKILRPENKIAIIHSFALTGQALKTYMRYFLYLYTHFNIVGMIGDRNGGLQFISSCNESEMFKNAGIELKYVEGVFDKPEDYHEDLVELKNSMNKTDHKICYLRNPSSQWIRAANELLQANVDHKRILFGSGAFLGDKHFDEQRKANVPISELKWEPENRSSGEAAKIDLIDYCKQNIELTKTQTTNIEVTTSPQGTQTFDLPLHMRKQTGKNRPRKDLYSSLVLLNWWAKIFFDAEEVNPEEGPDQTFVPFVV